MNLIFWCDNLLLKNLYWMTLKFIKKIFRLHVYVITTDTCLKLESIVWTLFEETFLLGKHHIHYLTRLRFVKSVFKDRPGFKDKIR